MKENKFLNALLKAISSDIRNNPESLADFWKVVDAMNEALSNMRASLDILKEEARNANLK